MIGSWSGLEGGGGGVGGKEAKVATAQRTLLTAWGPNLSNVCAARATSASHTSVDGRIWRVAIPQSTVEIAIGSQVAAVSTMRACIAERSAGGGDVTQMCRGPDGVGHGLRRKEVHTLERSSI